MKRKKIDTLKNKFIFRLFFLLFTLPSIAFATTYEVTPISDSDCFDGKCNLQAALDAAESNNGINSIIRLAQGEYIGNFTYFPSGINTGTLEITGGWSVDFSSRTLDPANTILNGNQTGTVLNLKFENPDAPAIIGGDLKLEGVTIKNGKAYIAGGLIAFTDAPYRIDVLNCIIENNHADDAAGGFAVGVYDWVSTDSDGTLYMENNIIRNNDVSMVGATDGNGGGGDVFVNGLAVLNNNLVYGNTVGNDQLQHGKSGGLAIDIVAGDLYLINNTITDNQLIGASTSDASGGGLSVNVKTPGNGNPVAWAPGHAYLYNNIIYGNTVSTNLSFGDDIANHVRNNTSETAGSSLLISNSNYSELWSGSTAVSPQLTDNVLTDPLLSTNSSTLYQLTTTSPCIDTGLNSAPNLSERDLTGNIRKWDGNADGTNIVDMGCYEYGSRDDEQASFTWNLFLPAIVSSEKSLVTSTIQITNWSIEQTVNYVDATGKNATINIGQNQVMPLVVQEGSVLEATVFNPYGPTGSLMIDGDFQSGCIAPPGPASVTISSDATLMITDC